MARQGSNRVDIISEDWLRDVGFKWHQLDRQPAKHWLLWLGNAAGHRNRFTGLEDMGIELAPSWWKNVHGNDVGDVGSWYCWLRSDTAGRYHRFIHIRHLDSRAELIRLIESLAGQTWDPDNHFYGSMQTPENAERIRQDLKRFDQQLTTGAPPSVRWFDVEKDDTRGRALPEHLEDHARRNRDDGYDNPGQPEASA